MICQLDARIKKTSKIGLSHSESEHYVEPKSPRVS